MADISIDYALRDLRFRQVNAMNTGDTETFANNFLAEGIWECAGSFSLVGRAAIREKADGWRKIFQWLVQINYDAAVLSASETEARARAYFVEYGLRVGGTAQFVFGVYDEVCVWDGGAWRYARRTCYPLYLGPPDLSAPIRQFPAPPA